MPNADLIRAVRRDHEEIKSLLGAVHAQRDADAFARLVRKLVVHETTEQEMVHARAARARDGESIARARLEAELAGARVLERLASTGVEAPGFPSAFARFRHDVLAQAERGQRDEHPELAEAAGPDLPAELGEIFGTGEQGRIDASA